MSEEVTGGSESSSAAVSAWANEPETTETPESKVEEAEPTPAPKKAEATPPDEEDEPAAEKKAAAEKADDKPAEPVKKTYKTKVRGAEQEIPAEDIEKAAGLLGITPEQLIRGGQMTRAAQEAMREVASVRKQAQEVLDTLRRDPLAAAKMAGMSDAELQTLAEKRVYAAYQAEIDASTGHPLTPEQKRIRELEAKLSEQENAKKSEADKVKAEEEGKAATAAQEEWTRSIVSALEKRGEQKWLLPRVAGHMADAVAHAVDSGLTIDLKDFAEDAIDLALEDIQAEHARAYDAMPYEEIKAKLPGLVAKIRKGIVADFKAKKAAPPPKHEEPSEEERPQRRQREERTRTTRDALREFVGR